MVEQGKFKAEVAKEPKIEPGKTDAVVVEFNVLSGPSAGESITAWLYLSDKALPYTSKKLDACGWKGKFSDFSGMAGVKVMITVDHEIYDGETRAKVGFIDPYREGEENGVAADPSAIAAKWQAKLDALTGKSSTVAFPD